MKTINDLKELKNINKTPIEINPEIQLLIDNLFHIVQEFNNNSVNHKKYNVDISNEPSDKEVKDINFSFYQDDYPNKTVLFEMSTTKSFYRTTFSNMDTYMTSKPDVDDEMYSVDQIRFNQAFSNLNPLYKEIVEDFMVKAFLNNEKKATKEKKFQEVLDQKRSRNLRTG